jgi:hypothetical protein
VAITFVAHAEANSAGAQVAPGTGQAITVPGGVQHGDLIEVYSVALPLTSTPGTQAATSTGSAPAQAGVPVTGSEPLPASVNGTIFQVIANAGEPTKVITVKPSASAFMAIGLAVHRGVNTSKPFGIISNPGAFGGANTASVTTPTVTAPSPAGQVPLFLGGGAAEGGALTVPAGSTSRSAIVSSSDVAAAIADAASVSGGTAVGGGTFTTSTAANSVLIAHTATLNPNPAPNIIPVFQSTDGAGVQTWLVSSPLNGAALSTLRILPPSAPVAGRAHAFLFMLPVSTGTDATFGDPPTVIESLNAHNNYNVTVVVPSFPIDPWYADNPNDGTVSQESFMLQLVTWMLGSSFAQGGEKCYLLGFSKSGLGGAGLLFRHPTVFDKGGFWDAPFMMTDYDGSDATFPGAPVGGNPANAYGTSANFTANYQLSGAHLATWRDASDFATRNRVWIGGRFSFAEDVAAFKSLLTTTGILHSEYLSVDTSHAWHEGWVADALAHIMPSSGSGALMASGLV